LITSGITLAKSEILIHFSILKVNKVTTSNMAKRPTFKATKDPRKGWRVNVPAPFTASGKREQRFFRNRDQANEFAQPLRAMYREVGTQRRIMPLVDSDDAAAALVLLKPLESTLRDAARFYLKHHDRRSKAPTVGHAIKDGIAHRKGLSAVYLSNLRQMERRLPDSFKAMNLADVDSEHVKKALDAKMKGATAWKDGLRMLSVLLQDQVKAGVLENNPCKGVVIPKSRDLEEVSYYTVEQLKALFAACRPYSDRVDRDCRDCAVPFAFLAFAGLRPAELERLLWADVSVENENIRLRKAVTKTNKTRNVPINVNVFRSAV
jgi:integrase/recombinase XerD